MDIYLTHVFLEAGTYSATGRSFRPRLAGEINSFLKICLTDIQGANRNGNTNFHPQMN
jgi:hypothetical protein